MSDRDYSNADASDMPNRLVGNHVNQPTAEDVREMKANLTGFFAVLREWSEKEKARPPPSTLQIAEQQTDPIRLSG